MKYHQPVQPGKKLAGFRVLAEIGRGAASTIYLVQSTKSKRVWALKHVEKHSEKDQRYIEQAESEYQIAQAVKSPLIRNIERLIRGRSRLFHLKEVFLLMEYVDGVSIEQKPPATFEDALKIFVQAARGLSHMHAVGYVHADIKPNNIVVDAEGVVKIIDLGQACAKNTVKERIQGTPDYMAPEQVQRKKITPRTDVYNLGATMYWILTQHHIPTAMASAESSLAGVTEIAMPDEAEEVIKLNPRVPQELSDLIMKCVQASPEDRPETMNAVRLGLESALEKLRSTRKALASTPHGPGDVDSADESVDEEFPGQENVA